jgi:hypothetical protein
VLHMNANQSGKHNLGYAVLNVNFQVKYIVDKNCLWLVDSISKMKASDTVYRYEIYKLNGFNENQFQLVQISLLQ